jgi:catechol 2,3-dioxygenase-like lactoylglutathione lyase family enzyme
MHLEHVNLVVTDIDSALSFYQAAFPHWRVRGRGNSLWYGKPRTWLHFGDDESYITFNDNGEGENRDLTGHQPGLAHFGFVTDNLEALVARLRDAGFEPDKEGAGEPFRSNIYYIDPAGFEVEFVQYHSDLPHERNRYANR